MPRDLKGNYNLFQFYGWLGLADGVAGGILMHQTSDVDLRSSFQFGSEGPFVTSVASPHVCVVFPSVP